MHWHTHRKLKEAMPSASHGRLSRAFLSSVCPWETRRWLDRSCTFAGPCPSICADALSKGVVPRYGGLHHSRSAQKQSQIRSPTHRVHVSWHHRENSRGHRNNDGGPTTRRRPLSARAVCRSKIPLILYSAERKT